MPPVHVAPDRRLRIVLVEHVIPAAKKYWTVGIVHPIVCGKQMVLGSKRIRCQLAAQRNILPLTGERAEVRPTRSQRGRTQHLQYASSGKWHWRGFPLLPHN